MKALIYILATAAMISSCRSVEKLIDQGDFDTAMLKSMRKLSGKEQLKEKYVVAIEEAFAKATSRDMSYIKNQFDSERASDWYQIIERLRKIERRQNLLSPMLPLISREGRKADFAFIRTSLLLDSAIQQFHQFTLLDAEQLMEEARLGNKESARDAYYMLERLGEFSRPSTIVKDLQREARELGVTHISVGVQNRTYSDLPEELIDDLIASGFQDNQWTRYYFDKQTPEPDRQITVILQNIDISPEHIREQIKIDEREIEDGFKYQLDENGNVQKDSLGNDIKVPVYKWIKARVVETRQQKEGFIAGYILNTNRINGKTQQVPFESQVAFEHVYAKFRGDQRALSPESKTLLGSSPRVFPSNQQMVIDLMHTLKPVINSRIRQLDIAV